MHQLTIGQLARLACVWEVTARKAGNVCPGHEFPDLTVNDFVRSADAIAPVLDLAPTQPLGVTILRCIEETRKVVDTNTNLGIVLLLAPLASVPLDQPLAPGVAAVLRRTTLEDSRNVYKAIRLAKPSGIGSVNDQDVVGEPTLPLNDVMALAKHRDLIAAQYGNNFDLLVDGALTLDLVQRVRYLRNMERAIMESQISFMVVWPDSLVARKCGTGEALKVSRAALDIPVVGEEIDPSAYRDFDAWLRSDNHKRNPGTTADFIAAALFVALREKQISPDAPFLWADHPMK